MNKSNEEIDKVIHEALNKEEAEFYDQLGEQSIIEMAFNVYTGKDRWLKVIIALLTFLFFAGFVYSAIQFFETEMATEMIKWLGIGSLFFGMSMALKLWQWMQMDKNAILREMRRIELQLSIIAKS
ncbi:MAG: DUF6768 family protein, partial [Bacteroidota bacterium]